TGGSRLSGDGSSRRPVRDRGHDRRRDDAARRLRDRRHVRSRRPDGRVGRGGKHGPVFGQPDDEHADAGDDQPLGLPELESHVADGRRERRHDHLQCRRDREHDHGHRPHREDPLRHQLRGDPPGDGNGLQRVGDGCGVHHHVNHDHLHQHHDQHVHDHDDSAADDHHDVEHHHYVHVLHHHHAAADHHHDQHVDHHDDAATHDHHDDDHHHHHHHDHHHHLDHDHHHAPIDHHLQHAPIDHHLQHYDDEHASADHHDHDLVDHDDDAPGTAREPPAGLHRRGR